MIRTATIDDYESIVPFIDTYFSKEGYGFVNREQIKTEILKKRVIISLEENQINGLRIGWDRVWNVVVKTDCRGKGIGKELIEYHRPNYIRVKSNPVGHLNKTQKANFIDPTEFYEKLGFVYVGHDYGRNFWAGQSGDKRIPISKGEKKHIKLYRNPENTWW